MKKDELQSTEVESAVFLEHNSELSGELNFLREQFNKRYFSFRIVGYVAIAIVLAIVITAYVVVFPLEPNGVWAGIILIIFALVGSMVFNKINRNKLMKVIRKYMLDYHDKVNQAALKDHNIKNFVFDFEGKMNADEFANARIAKDIVKTNSRNLLSYQLDENDISISDYVAYRNYGKRLESVFVGKLIVASRKKKIDNRIVIYIKPNPEAFKDSGGPDDVEDLTMVLDTYSLKVFAKDDSYSKVVTKDVISACNEIETNKILPDATISIYDSKVVIAATYGDAMMVVPHKEAVPIAGIEQFKDNLATFHKIIKTL